MLLEPAYIGETGIVSLGDIKYTNGPGNPNKPISTVTANSPSVKTVNPTASNQYTALYAPADYATLLQALVDAGDPDPTRSFTHLWMESGRFTNGPYKKDNNPGNIMWPYHGYSKGVYIPSNKTYAVHFPTINDFATAYIDILSKGAMPISATSLADFAHRLKMNNYYGKEGEASYLAKLQAAAKQIRDVALPVVSNEHRKEYQQATDHPYVWDPAKGDTRKENWWERQSMIVKGLIIGGSALVVIKILD